MDRNDILILEPERTPDAGNMYRLGDVLDYPRLKFPDGEGCITLLEKYHPKLVIVSHNPPDCDAISIVESLKNGHPEMMFVVDIPGGAPDLVRRAFLAGASDCLLDEDLSDADALRLRLSGMLSVSDTSVAGAVAEREIDRIRPVLDNICDSISIQDAELNVLYQNPAHRGLVGDHIGEKCFEAYAEGDRPCEGCPVISSFEDGLPHRVVKEGPGGLVMDISSSPLRGKDGRIWGGLEIVRDVTDRQRLEDALRNTAEGVSAQTGESFFHSLTEFLVKTLGVSTSFIGLIDDNDPEVSRTLSFYHRGSHGNNFWYRIDGTPCGEVARRGLCVFGDGVQDSFPTIDMLKQIDAKCYVGAPLVASDGRPLGVLSVLDNKPMTDAALVESLLMIFAARVSAELDRLKVESALRESGRRLTEMLENVKLCAVMLDTSGKVTFANDFLLELTGRGRDEVLGGGWFGVFVPPEESDERERNFLNTVKSEYVPPHEEYAILAKDGEPRLVSWSNTLLKDDSGVVTGVCSIGEDITDRKKAELERSELFHMMTHDIKGPLSIINGYSELILAENAPSTAHEYASEISKASRRIFGLIEDMLTLSAMETVACAPRFEQINLNEVVEQAAFDMRVRAEEMNVRITSDLFAGGAPILNCDRGLLRRAVENLIINAINYNKFGGEVKLVTEKSGAGVYLEVSDTGSGIPESDLPHIFDKYYRSKVTGKKHGTGLGLAIVRRAVESCGGSVSARNNDAGGATFRVELPAKG